MTENNSNEQPLGSKKRAQRVGRLHTVGHIVSEMGKLYRQARRGEIEDGKAYRLASILVMMRQAKEASDIENRLAALEGNGAEGQSRSCVSPKLLTDRSAA